MTRSFVFAAVLVAVTISPLAAQTSAPSGTSSPASRYRLGPTKTSSQPAPTKPGQNQAGSGPREQVLGPAAPTSRTTTDRNVRPAGDNQPIREPGTGQLPPRRAIEKGIPGAVQPRADAPPQPPEWFPLAPNVQQFVDDVLHHWELTSEKVQYYECKYQKWSFDPVFGPKAPDTPRFFSRGEIKYQDPDKGLFRDITVWEYVGLKEGEDPKAKPKSGEPPPGWQDALALVGDHWVCDGMSVYQYDSQRKRLIQTILPQEMQGKTIADGPLPFLFGAKANVINQRYWIRPLTPPKDVRNEYWLEAVPRTRQDAQNFQKVQIVLAKEDFFPSKLSVYPPNYDPKRNPARQEYQFADRVAHTKNDKAITLKDLQFWKTQFYQPKVPFGWKKETQNLNNPPVVNGPQPAPTPQARKPKSGLKFK